MRLTTKVVYNYVTPDNVENIDVRVHNKLGQLEDIEDELGIDLITYTKITQNGFYGVIEEEGGLEWHFFKPQTIRINNKTIEVIGSSESIDEIEINLYLNEVWQTYKIEDKNKTWALTKEELK